MLQCSAGSRLEVSRLGLIFIYPLRLLHLQIGVLHQIWKFLAIISLSSAPVAIHFPLLEIHLDICGALFLIPHLSTYLLPYVLAFYPKSLRYSSSIILFYFCTVCYLTHLLKFIVRFFKSFWSFYSSYFPILILNIFYILYLHILFLYLYKFIIWNFIRFNIAMPYFCWLSFMVAYFLVLYFWVLIFDSRPLN